MKTPTRIILLTLLTISAAGLLSSAPAAAQEAVSVEILPRRGVAPGGGGGHA